jgi:SCF-associated factor 1
VPTELPLGTPGGYSAESQLIKSRQSQWGPLAPPRVASPSPVHFNYGPNPGGRRFCFAATAAGWQTGALVVCLEPEKEVYDDSTFAEGEPEPSIIPRFGLPVRRFTGGEAGEAPSGSPNEPSAPSDAGVLGFAGRMFRIGYAGRGRGAPGT